MMAAFADRSRGTESAPRRVWVDRERARFGAWYEFFPRSAGPDADRSGTFREAAAELPRISDLGFDVIYLPPIHPIGTSFRKGRNNALAAGPADPGSPWAIGSADGGHTSINPALGTLEDFRSVQQRGTASHGSRARPRVAVLSRSPWVHDIPSGSATAPARSNSREPAEEVPGHLPVRLRVRRMSGGCGRRCSTVTLYWGRPRVRMFRVDNPTPKRVRVLGMDDRSGARAAADSCSSPRRSPARR